MKPYKTLSTFLNSYSDQNFKPRNRILIWISISLAILFLYLALRDLDWQAFFGAIKSAQYIYLPFIFIWISFSYFIRALRWRVLLVKDGHLSISNVFWANMAGYIGNNILPARAGELIRAAYISKRENINATFAFATGMTERLVDLMALIIIGSESFASTGLSNIKVQNALKAGAIFGTIGFLGIMLLPYFEKFWVKSILFIPLINENQKSRLTNFLLSFLQGLKPLHEIKRAAIFIFLTLNIWGIDGITLILFAHTLNLTLPFQQAFVLLAGLGLSSAIPSTPGYIGIYQFIAATILVPFGFSKVDAIALVIFGQINGYLILFFWGGISTLKAYRDFYSKHL